MGAPTAAVRAGRRGRAGARPAVTPEAVLDTLGPHLLVDRSDFVLDVVASRGSWLVDARTGTRYLDLFSFFASNALGMNHPALRDDEAFRRELIGIALNKPSNSDVATTHLAAFVETFLRVAGDPALGHLFFIEGGALAVENALKAAFDWKSRLNERAGRDPALGSKVLHLERAFHGRSGYTLSLTNTEPTKTDRFPKFDWPRIPVPTLHFPIAKHLSETVAAEDEALAAARAAFASYPHDIACFIAEPIQGEGGDNHMRAEFLQAMQELSHAQDALFVLDEVQTGGGATGTMWCYQQLGLEPDVVAFGKKFQVGGVMAGRRIDDIEDHVFAVPGRINSTWGGNLTDMVRARRILEVIEDEGLAARAGQVGSRLLDDLAHLAAAHPAVVRNVRGRGLLCAFDLPHTAARDRFLELMRERERVLMLGCGTQSVRFRPPLTISEDEVAAAVEATDRVARTVEEET